MKTVPRPMLKKPFVPVFVALAALAGTSAQAQTADGSIQADVSLASSKTISQGEPIVLKYKISNVSDAQIVMDIGTDGPTWLSQSLSDAAGYTIRGHEAIDPNNANSHLGLFNGGEIAAHGSFTDYVVASQWFPALGPGKYTLTAHVHVPYENVTHMMVEREFRFPLVVMPFDPKRVQSAAQALAVAAAQTPVTEAAKRKMLVYALFSMPEAQASRSWRGITSGPASSAALLSDAVEDLGRLQSATATDILLEMLTNPAQAHDAYLESSIAGALAGTYRDANAPLRQHIRALYASRGMPLADIVCVPSKAGGGN